MSKLSKTDNPLSQVALLAALIEGKFVPMTKQDLMGFAGIEYTGYLWALEDEETLVVADRGPGHIMFQVLYADGDWSSCHLSLTELE